MKQKIFGYIAIQINRLTDDEDLRQDLWILFLEGRATFSFKDYLNREYDECLELEDGVKERF
jgi:hypothetical protein